MQSQATAQEESIKETYQKLKKLLQDNEVKAARAYLRTINFRDQWEDLLHYAMTKRNCPVTKLIIVHVVHCRLLTKTEIQRRVSVIDHRIQKEFIGRLQEYLKSEAFDIRLEEYSAVRKTVGMQLQASAGVALINPNAF